MIVHPPVNCPECAGTGIVQRDGDDVACSCILEKLQRRDPNSAGIPNRFQDKTLENFKQDTREQHGVHTAVSKFLKDIETLLNDDSSSPGFKYSSGMIKNSLLLYGRVGSGKTHLAVAALKKMMDMGLDGRFWNVNDLFREMRAKFGEGQGDETLLDDLMECDVLVLDDLGTHRSTDFVLDRLYLIINQRYEAMKPIIVTTNLELGQLYEEFEERIGSRLNEMCFLVSFMGEDFRMRAVEKQRKL